MPDGTPTSMVPLIGKILEVEVSSCMVYSPGSLKSKAQVFIKY